jgi:hypothetical protein
VSVILAFIIGVAVLVSVGVRVCIVVRRELQDDLEHRRVTENVAVARMRLRRLQHDAQRQQFDAVIDVGDQ